ncbi:MAG: DNA polymerase/3'-5' exonuclease PolX [Solirubrobacterales bacterium]
MTNAEIAAALDELGDLYELDGAVIYRVVAYREAAKAIRDSPVSVAQLAREGRATELRNVGKTLQEKIQALLETGDIPAAVKLRSKFPGELVQFTHIPGLGPKTARRIHDELGISTLEELRDAAEQERLRSVSGLGPKAEQNIARALARLEEEGPAERLLLSAVLAIGEQIVTHLRSHPAADRVEIAGSARRMTDTCKDLDIVATATDPAALTRAFTEMQLLGSVGSGGDAAARGVTHNGLRIDFRVVEPDQYGNVLQHLTGSKQHNVELREYAVRRGLHVSEYGVEEEESGKVHRCPAEEEVYAVLGLPFIEPELREGRGELAAAREGTLPELVTESDLRGDLHCHTTLSDGRSSLEDMARTAQERGYEYLAVTDHSASHGFGNDVQADELLRQVGRVRELNERLDGFRVLAGSEVNIDPDGSLDYDDDVLAELDWVVASVHTSFRIGEQGMTERMMAAMDHPLVDAIGHPTGRLILRRDPYAVDVERVVEHAARTGTMLEINANPDRRDLSDVHARLAAEAGAMIVIDSDAHSARTLSVIRYGVATARRGWLTRENVANTRPWRELAKLRKRNLRAGRRR